MEFLSNVGHLLLVALVFLLIFSVLIILHELGHFWMARWGSVRIEEFGFGLPPKLWGKKTSHKIEKLDKNGKKRKVKEEMEWTINAIPFGGFVRMLGEDMDAKSKNDPRAFCNRPLLWRMGITVGGVTMNFLLALVLFAFVAMIGFSPMVDPNLEGHPKFASYFADGHVQELVEKGFYAKGEKGVFFLGVNPESPAGKAEFLSGDKVLSVNGVRVRTPGEFQNIQSDAAKTGAPIEYTLERFDPQARTTEMLLKKAIPEENEEGKKLLGVLLADHYYYPLKEIQLPVGEAFVEGVHTSRRFIILSVDMVRNVLASTLGKMMKFQVPEIPEGVGGPVAIASMTNSLVEIGDISKIIQFAAVLSLSLAVINLVPFPALDGGRLFFQVLELLFFAILWPIKKFFPKLAISHRISQKLETPVHVVGYVLLLCFIAVVTWNDVVRIFFE